MEIRLSPSAAGVEKGGARGPVGPPHEADGLGAPPRELPRRRPSQKASMSHPLDNLAELIAKREPVDVTVWYDFGSAHLRGQAAGSKYEMDLRTEMEMAARHYVCSLDAGTPWALDLVTDGGKPRSAPPAEKDLHGWSIVP